MGFGLFIFVLVLVVVLLIKFAGKGRETAGEFRRARFMSEAEVRFYKVLAEGVGAKYRVFAKPRLRDIVYAVDSDGSRWRSTANRLSMKHVDFLLCDPATLAPVCVVELDDSSHSRSDRQARDGFVDEVMRAAGIPIVHFPVRSAYTADDLLRQLGQALPALWVVKDADQRPKSRATLIPTDPPPLPKDIKYMPPAARAQLEKSQGD